MAIEASSELAAERGAYSSYQGSLWSQGIFPIDSLQKLIEKAENESKNGKSVEMENRADLI